MRRPERIICAISCPRPGHQQRAPLLHQHLRQRGAVAQAVPRVGRPRPIARLEEAGAQHERHAAIAKTPERRREPERPGDHPAQRRSDQVPDAGGAAERRDRPPARRSGVASVR
jgi:hypothetical protein